MFHHFICPSLTLSRIHKLLNFKCFIQNITFSIKHHHIHYPFIPNQYSNYLNSICIYYFSTECSVNICTSLTLFTRIFLAALLLCFTKLIFFYQKNVFNKKQNFLDKKSIFLNKKSIGIYSTRKKFKINEILEQSGISIFSRINWALLKRIARIFQQNKLKNEVCRKNASFENGIAFNFGWLLPFMFVVQIRLKDIKFNLKCFKPTTNRF